MVTFHQLFFDLLDRLPTETLIFTRVQRLGVERTEINSHTQS
jgi:hypothetical protein